MSLCCIDLLVWNVVNDVSMLTSSFDVKFDLRLLLFSGKSWKWSGRWCDVFRRPRCRLLLVTSWETGYECVPGFQIVERVLLSGFEARQIDSVRWEIGVRDGREWLWKKKVMCFGEESLRTSEEICCLIKVTRTLGPNRDENSRKCIQDSSGFWKDKIGKGSCGRGCSLVGLIH